MDQHATLLLGTDGPECLNRWRFVPEPGVCGANIDNRAFANVLQRVMIRDGRLMRLVFDIPDKPGVLSEISTRIGQAGASFIEVSHHLRRK
jgi:hypothetical protein